jgi:uncharacterized membrane protein YeaQ/YmgE (transglycosylase-associated protein family)
MNVAMWVLAGGVLGWIGFAYLQGNRNLGLATSMIIGAVGGFFGGNELAPMLGAVTDTPNTFNLFSLAVALLSAAACLTIASLLTRRFGSETP